MTIIYGKVVDAFTQDMHSEGELETGVKVSRLDKKATSEPQHVIDTYYLSKRLAAANGSAARRTIGEGSVILAEKNSDIALSVGFYSKNNVGFGVSIETGGTVDQEGSVFVTDLYFPAARRDGWIYGYIDRGDDGTTLRIKPKSALGDAAQAAWKVRISIWPILKWEGGGEIHEQHPTPRSMTRSGNTQTGGLTSGENIGTRGSALHTRIIESDTKKRNYQSFYVMTGTAEEVATPVLPVPA